MPFPHALPTTSAASLASSFTSASHPSLIFSATSQRALVRDVLKKHKRLGPSQQVANLPSVQSALNAYLPYLLSIYQSSPDTASSTNYGGVTQISASETNPLSTSWRSTLSSSIAGREPPRIKVDGLRNELAFVLQTLAYTYTLLARSVLLDLARTTSPSATVRATAIATAMKHLLDANSILTFACTLPLDSVHAPPIDVVPSTTSALAALALAEATLIVVSKDDPYSAAVADARDVQSKDWMISAPSIPKVRALLFARLCVAAADHASTASGLLGGSRIDEDLVRYATDLRRTARGKAARFLGVDAEAGAKTGEAIAWLRGAKMELGAGAEEGRKGFRGLKQTWSERKEDRRMEKGEDWGLDAGRLEEIRVVEWLEAKWVKSNDTINVQPVPPYQPLMAAMPSGREYHTPKRYTPPTLEPSVLNSLRAPVDPPQRAFAGEEDDSDDEAVGTSDPPGAFPGSSGSYY